MTSKLDASIRHAAERLRGRTAWGVLLAVAVFYAVTAAGNHAEADDDYAFAWRVEQVAATQFDDPRLLGYHLLARGLWLGAQTIGFDGLRGRHVLYALSWLSAVGCLALLWRLLWLRCELPRAVALLGTAALAFSYGFWRYAVEANVYACALLICCAQLHGLLAPAARRPGVAAALGVAAGAGVLFYQPNAISLLMVFPWLVLQRGGWRTVTGYVAAAAATVAAGYGMAFLAYWPEPLSLAALKAFMAQRTQEFMVPPLSLRVVAGSVLRSALALGHDIAATSWAFALEPVQRLAQRLFSGHQLDDDFHLARHAGAWAWLGLITWPVLLASALRLLVSAGWPAWTALKQPWVATTVLWAVLTALVIGRLNPGGLEAWIVMLLPLALLFARLVLMPSMQRDGSRWAAVFVAALALHNMLGGMALVRDARGDLVGQRCAAIAALAREPDLVLGVTEAQLAECLRYESKAEALTVFAWTVPALVRGLATPPGETPAFVLSIGRASHAGRDVQQIARERLSRGGRVLVLDDFLRTDRYKHLIRAEDNDLMQAARQNSPLLLRLPDGAGLYELRPPPGAAR